MERDTPPPNVEPGPAIALGAAPTVPFDWNDLPALSPAWRPLRPGSAIKAMALIALVPVVCAGVYSFIPRAGRLTLGTTSVVISLLGLVGAVAFLLLLLAYRVLRKQRQLRLNVLLRDYAPERFVLYLRSFRRAGATVVPNQLETLAERRLLGNFLDVELALSLAIGERLPVVAVGSTPDGLGAAKLSVGDAVWHGEVKRLAVAAVAVFIVPDDREGTLWEMNQLLGDWDQRSKVIVLMPPEQHGWWRRLRRLPTVAQSWEIVRSRVPHLQLPPYDQEGAFLLPDASEHGYASSPLQHFAHAHVRSLVAAAASGVAPPQPIEAAPTPDENWRAFIDPIWPVVTLAALLALPKHEGSSGFEALMLAVLCGWTASSLVASVAYTHTRTAVDVAREPLHASTWLGLRRAPGVVREAFNVLVLVAFIASLRCFVVEPFKVPSGSMIPTMVVGDVILVSKSAYGPRLPLSSMRLMASAMPARGDIVVFRYPVDTTIDYIKRVVGLPGDEVGYLNKQLTINGKPVETSPLPDYYDEDSLRYSQRWREKLGEVSHDILTNSDRRPGITPFDSFPNKDACRYSTEGVVCKVPAGQYFTMGDNRDNSQDSRYWGFVPNEFLVGRAFVIWWNWDALGRIGTKI